MGLHCLTRKGNVPTYVIQNNFLGSVNHMIANVTGPEYNPQE